MIFCCGAYSSAPSPKPQEVQEDWVLLHKLNFFQYLSGLETYLPNWANDAGRGSYTRYDFPTGGKLINALS